jgi:hypothetical protein
MELLSPLPYIEPAPNSRSGYLNTFEKVNVEEAEPTEAEPTIDSYPLHKGLIHLSLVRPPRRISCLNKDEWE